MENLAVGQKKEKKMIENTARRIEHMMLLKNGALPKNHNYCSDCGRSSEKVELCQINEYESLCDDCFEK